jgi:hypothetical protein
MHSRPSRERSDLCLEDAQPPSAHLMLRLTVTGREQKPNENCQYPNPNNGMPKQQR